MWEDDPGKQDRFKSYLSQKAQAAFPNDSEKQKRFVEYGLSKAQIVPGSIQAPKKESAIKESFMAPIRAAGKGLNEAGEILNKENVAAPIRYGSAALRAAKGLVVDPFTTAIGRGLETANYYAGNPAGRAIEAAKSIIPEKVKTANEKYQSMVESFKEKHPNVGEMDRAALNALELLPLEGAITKGSGALIKGAGKKLLKGEMKIPDKIALKAGKTVEKGQKQIIQDIDKMGLESSKGFSGITDKAQETIAKKMDVSKDALEGFYKENPNSITTLDEVAAAYKNKILNDEIEGIAFDEKDAALKMVDDKITALKKSIAGPKVDTDLPLELNILQADKARKELSKGMFKKGAFNRMNDPIGTQIKEDLSLMVRDKMAEFIPAQKMANREIRDAINVKNAAIAAQKRIASHNQILSPSNAMAAMLGLGAGMEGSAAAFLAKKILESGRGASTMISGGKAMEKAAELLKKLPKKTSVGAIAAEKQPFQWPYLEKEPFPIPTENENDNIYLRNQ